MSVLEFKASVTTAPTSFVLISIEGEVDMASAPTLTELIDTALQVGKPNVVVDMSGVTFIDSQGLRTLIMAEKRAREVGVSLMLRSPSKRVRDLLVLTGVDSMFAIDRPLPTALD